MEQEKKNQNQPAAQEPSVGDQIKVTYREFSGDIVRPGFAQDVQYDLSAEKTIGFKGVRIEVISATNTKLVYRVQKSFLDVP